MFVGAPQKSCNCINTRLVLSFMKLFVLASNPFLIIHFKSILTPLLQCPTTHPQKQMASKKIIINEIYFYYYFGIWNCNLLLLQLWFIYFYVVFVWSTLLLYNTVYRSVNSVTVTIFIYILYFVLFFVCWVRFCCLLREIWEQLDDLIKNIFCCFFCSVNSNVLPTNKTAICI